nr:prepilin-type N-terminal cleavage/methylation domain-containing protein [Salinicola sp. CR57]
MRRQGGFTLIELMIVVAIIGILAAIAIPQYQNYIARSQFAESHTLLGGARVALQEKVDQGATTAIPDNLGINTQGQYGAIISTDTNAISTGPVATLTYQFGEGTGVEASPSLTAAGANQVTYTYEDGTNGWGWSCSTTVPQAFASNCSEATPAGGGADTP